MSRRVKIIKWLWFRFVHPHLSIEGGLYPDRLVYWTHIKAFGRTIAIYELSRYEALHLKEERL